MPKLIMTKTALSPSTTRCQKFRDIIATDTVQFCFMTIYCNSQNSKVQHNTSIIIAWEIKFLYPVQTARVILGQFLNISSYGS